MKSKKVKSTLILLLTAIIWGFAFVAQRAGSEHVGSFTYNAVRFAVGALSLVPVILIFERGKSTPEQRKRTVMYGVIAGVVLFSAANLQQFGILFTQSAGKSAFITGLYTVLVPIVYAFCGKKTGINVWIGAALTVGGLYLLCGSYAPVHRYGILDGAHNHTRPRGSRCARDPLFVHTVFGMRYPRLHLRVYLRGGTP